MHVFRLNLLHLVLLLIQTYSCLCILMASRHRSDAVLLGSIVLLVRKVKLLADFLDLLLSHAQHSLLSVASQLFSLILRDFSVSLEDIFIGNHCEGMS